MLQISVHVRLAMLEVIVKQSSVMEYCPQILVQFAVERVLALLQTHALVSLDIQVQPAV